MKVAFWLLWGFDALVSLVIFAFFVWGLADGSVSDFNIGLWAVLLLIPVAVLVGSPLLRTKGHPVLGLILLLFLALPGLVALLFLAAILILQPRWN